MPAAGRLTHWLALETPRVTRQAAGSLTRVDVVLTYQIVNVDEDVTDIPVPHHDLHYTDGSVDAKILIPATRISVSPLRPSESAALRPDRAPETLPQRPFVLVALAAVVIAATLGIVHVVRGSPRADGSTPFTALRHELRRVRAHEWDAERCRMVLREIHRAFNETAGRTVFTETLPEFFEQHARFAALETAIKDFFARTRACFYGADEAGEQPPFSLRDVTEFVQRCSDCERGLA